MTTGQRLAFLSGLSSANAGAHLYAIRQSGISSGAILVSRSLLPSGSAMMHLLDDGSPVLANLPPIGGFMANMGTFMGRM